jgi:hypothetical protein
MLAVGRDSSRRRKSVELKLDLHRGVCDNPVKARLVQSWEQWPWTYVKPALL